MQYVANDKLRVIVKLEGRKAKVKQSASIVTVEYLRALTNKKAA